MTHATFFKKDRRVIKSIGSSKFFEQYKSLPFSCPQRFARFQAPTNQAGARVGFESEEHLMLWCGFSALLKSLADLLLFLRGEAVPVAQPVADLVPILRG